MILIKLVRISYGEGEGGGGGGLEIQLSFSIFYISAPIQHFRIYFQIEYVSVLFQV